MAREPDARPWRATRRDALALALLLVPLALLYALTMCPTVGWYDSAEFAGHAVSLQHAHAPGYPSYLLIAHVFAQLGPEPAWGTNSMSVVFALGSVTSAYLLQRAIGVRESFAAVLAFALGVSPTLWANTVITEVYTPGLCLTLTCLLLLVLGQDPGRRKLIPIAAGVAGFGLGMHLSLATCGLGFVLLAAAAGIDCERWSGLARVFGTTQWRARLRLAAWCVFGLAIGLSVFVVFPLLSFDDPLSRRAWLGWGRLITGRVFANKFVDGGDGLALRNFELLRTQLGWPGLLLAALGLVGGLWRRPLAGLALALAAGGNAWMFWNYQVHDIEVFWIPAAAIGFVLGGLALELLAEPLERRASRSIVTLVLTLGAAAWPLSHLRQTFSEVDASEATQARAYADLLIDALPQDALFVTYNHPQEWKYYGVLQYVQQGLGQRKDVRVKVRPNLDALDDKLAAGLPVFAFSDVARVRKRVDVERDGELFVVLRTNHKQPRK